ncbi:rod shape-determining protein MreC [bacterium]|nr:rod shape-determining protein MreC [bacterium]
MKLIRSQHRPWLVYTACSLISLAIITSNLKGGIVSSQIETVILNFMTPVYSSVNWSINKCRSYWFNYVALVDVQKENQLLKNKLEKMQQKQMELKEQAQSVKRLEALITESSQTAHSIVTTRVVRRTSNLLNATLLVNAGSRDGVKQGMGAATINGAIGQVVRVGPQIAKLLTLHHPDAGIGAILEKSRIQGVVSGTGKGTCVMRFVSRFDPIILGETVVTSGLDGAFPKGIPIGRVISIQRDPGEIFQSIEILPVADVNTLEEVIIFMMPIFSDPEANGEFQ